MYSPKFMISWFWSQHLFWTTLNVEVWFLYRENCFHICIYVLSSEKPILCIVCGFHTCKMNFTFVTLILYIKSTIALVSLEICSFFVSDHFTIVHLLLKIFPNLSMIILLLFVSFWIVWFCQWSVYLCPPPFEQCVFVNDNFTIVCLLLNNVIIIAEAHLIVPKC